MKKHTDRVITLRPGKLAEFVTVMVPVSESEADAYESWTIDSPLEEFVMEMVNYPLAEIDAARPANGKPKAARSKPRKKKPVPRRKP